jgi:hypothetical protein
MKGGPLKNEKSKADLHVYLGAFYIWSEFNLYAAHAEHVMHSRNKNKNREPSFRLAPPSPACS